MLAPKTSPPQTVTDLLFERARIGVCLVAPDGTVVRANATWLRSTGLTEVQVLGQNIIDLFPATREAALAMQERARAGHRVDVPRHAQTVNGRETWWEGFIEPVPMEGGTGLLITAREVTAEPREQELRASEERLRAFFQTVAVGTAELGIDGHFIAVNDRLCELTGYSRVELLGMTPADLAHPDDRRREELRLSEYLRGGSPTYETEKRYIRKDGEVIWVLISAATVRDAAGRALGSEGIIQDITERKRAEEALRESEERLRAAFTASPDAININRLSDGAYVSVNDGFTRMSGWSAADAIGRTAAELGVWADRDERARLMERLLADEAIHAADVTYRHKDGTLFTASISARIFTARGERFLLAISRDISDLRRAEEALRLANEKLREADRRKDEFLGMLSHELRNPLAPIRTSLFLLERAEPAGQEAHRAREVISRQVGHLTRLVDDLLDVTRVTRGNISLRRTDLDLTALVGRTAEDYRRMMEDRGIDLYVEPGERRLIVQGDETRLAQVFGNLLSNAAKFTPAGGRVTIAARAEGGRAVIRVQDTGPGIAPDVLPSIFEPFTQARQTLARAEGGLGLGLALVRGLVSLHGGEVKVASGSGGAEFIVTLPLAWRQDSRASPLASPAKAEASAAHRRVLVVDDNEDAADSLAELVRTLGHDAEVAYDGAAAVRRAGEYHPDVVLCDIGLPVMDGYAVAHELRAAHGRDVRLVAISGYAQPDDVTRAAEAGFDEHVAKPCGPEQIERLLS